MKTEPQLTIEQIVRIEASLFNLWRWNSKNGFEFLEENLLKWYEQGYDVKQYYLEFCDYQRESNGSYSDGGL